MITAGRDEIALKIMNFRKPTLQDASSISRLIRRSPPLDVNSHYLYLLLCHHFSDTCVVAEADSDVVGFLSGYRPPIADKTVFVWQVAVDANARGQGVAGGLLRELLSRDACADVRYLETTVGSTNEASDALFRSLAERLETECHTQTLFGEELFEGLEGDHEPEILYRIGPFDPVQAAKKGRL